MVGYPSRLPQGELATPGPSEYVPDLTESIEHAKDLPEPRKKKIAAVTKSPLVVQTAMSPRRDDVPRYPLSTTLETSTPDALSTLNFITPFTVAPNAENTFPSTCPTLPIPIPVTPNVSFVVPSDDQGEKGAGQAKRTDSSEDHSIV